MTCRVNNANSVFCTGLLWVFVLVTTACAGQAAQPARPAHEAQYIAYHDGTVADQKNNLMWSGKDNAESIDWFSAVKYCENLTLGGHTDWRLPSIEELKTLHDGMETEDVSRKPAILLSGVALWSSDEVNQPDKFGPKPRAMYLDFSADKAFSGQVYIGYKSRADGFLMPVWRELRVLPVRDLR